MSKELSEELKRLKAEEAAVNSLRRELKLMAKFLAKQMDVVREGTGGGRRSLIDGSKFTICGQRYILKLIK